MDINTFSNKFNDLIVDNFELKNSTIDENLTLSDLYSVLCTDSWYFYVNSGDKVWEYVSYAAPKNFLLLSLVDSINSLFWEIININDLDKMGKKNLKISEIKDFIYLKLKISVNNDKTKRVLN